jgi:hypothetical protein
MSRVFSSRSLFSKFFQLVSRSSKEGQRRKDRHTREQRRLLLESLEVRRNLATFLVNTFDDVVASDDQLSLREAISLAATNPGQDKIDLPEGTYTLTLGQLTINDASGALTIRSETGVATIDANSASRVFEIQAGSDVTFRGLAITHGQATQGAGVLNAGDLTVIDSAITSNTAINDGGGVYSTGSLTMKRSDVSSNRAFGNFLNLGKGAGIYVAGTATIDRSSVNGNTLFIGNGGGIYQDAGSTLTVTNSSVLNNQITVTGIGSDGGGGGLYSLGTATIDRSDFSSNQATVGGGIFGLGTITVTRSSMSGNTANRGGGLATAGTALIQKSTFSANDGFGGMAVLSGTATVEDSLFAGNLLGGFYNEGGTVTILRSNFQGNALAGGIVNDGTMDITDSKIESNSTQGNGGGISNSGVLTISDSTIKDNSADVSGGGLYNTATATFTDSKFLGNRASLFGGAVANDPGIELGTPILTIVDSILRGNSVDLFGGGVSNFAGTANITGSRIEDNQALVGGGLYNLSQEDDTFPRAFMTISETTVSGNAATGGGGGANFGGATLAVVASTFDHNSADFGGAIYNVGFYGVAAALTINNSTIAANTATQLAGAIYADSTQGGDSVVQIVSTTISLNSAGVQGGGVMNVGTTPVSINNTIVAGNTAPLDADVSGAFSSLGYNLIGIADGSTGFGSTGDLLGSSASPLDPKLGALANNGGKTKTMKLRNGSPALNAGDPSLAGTTDQRGVLRPQGGGVDIGAYERE